MPRTILPTLWLGHARDARNLSALHERGVRAVIDLAAEEPPAQLSRDLVYCRFPLLDGDGNPDWLLQSAIETTARLIEHRVPTLVACSGGMSRSPAVVAAACARLGRGALEECLKQAVGDGPQQVAPALWNAIGALLRGATGDRLV
jgi:protein-tyrosine phosphatase